jgi:hypothetical protein
VDLAVHPVSRRSTDEEKTRAMRSNHVGCDGDSESETGETSGWFPLGRPPKRSTATRARMASLTLEQGNPTDTQMFYLECTEKAITPSNAFYQIQIN